MAPIFPQNLARYDSIRLPIPIENILFHLFRQHASSTNNVLKRNFSRTHFSKESFRIALAAQFWRQIDRRPPWARTCSDDQAFCSLFMCGVHVHWTSFMKNFYGLTLSRYFIKKKQDLRTNFWVQHVTSNVGINTTYWVVGLTIMTNETLHA